MSTSSETFEEPGFNRVRHRAVREQEERDPAEIGERQRHHAEERRKRRVGQPDRHGHDGERGQQHRERGAALQERDFARPDDVHDERLRQKRLHEPAGLEERHGVIFYATRHRWVVENTAVEEKPHQGKGGVIENRADRPDHDHEPLDVADVPLARTPDLLLIDAVGGNAGLRKVVEQVVKQNLDRLHRQEG